MKENCDLKDGLKPDNLDVLALLQGVYSEDLRREILKEKDPKPNKLIQIARSWVHAQDMEKTFKTASSTRGARAKDSNYKKGKAESQQQKAKDMADVKADAKARLARKAKRQRSPLADAGGPSNTERSTEMCARP